MTYGAGSVGLNLQFASYVFLFDRWWNPAVEDQAINRAHRIGATGPVTVTRFLTVEHDRTADQPDPGAEARAVRHGVRRVAEGAPRRPIARGDLFAVRPSTAREPVAAPKPPDPRRDFADFAGQGRIANRGQAVTHGGSNNRCMPSFRNSFALSPPSRLPPLAFAPRNRPWRTTRNAVSPRHRPDLLAAGYADSAGLFHSASAGLGPQRLLLQCPLPAGRCPACCLNQPLPPELVDHFTPWEFERLGEIPGDPLLEAAGNVRPLAASDRIARCDPFIR